MRIKADWLTATAPRSVLQMLDEAGHQAFFVGGCVRNAILQEPATDIDIATNATPDQVIALAKTAGVKAVPTGIDHGTVTLVVDALPFEVTTFRKDVATDGRRAVVSFSTQIDDDAIRRDFTMNALYADSTGMVVDPLGGLPDLLARCVRFIQNGDERVKEDYLRILRFFRFNAWYGDPKGGLDSESLAACAANADGLEKLSKERIGSEIRKLLSAAAPQQAVAAMAQCGVLARVLAGANATVIAPLIHAEQKLGIPPDWRRRLAVLGQADWTDDLRLSRADARYLTALNAAVNSAQEASELAYRHGKELATSAVLVRSASLEMPVTETDIAQIEIGSAAKFPVAAQDLQKKLAGKALGDKLRMLEGQWIASGFKLKKQELLE